MTAISERARLEDNMNPGVPNLQAPFSPFTQNARAPRTH